MKVKVLKMHPNSVLPKKAYPNDFCYDAVAVSEEEIAPNVWKYRLGLAFQIERQPETIVVSTCYHGGKEKLHSTKIDFSRSPINVSIDARPRSSIWKTGMILSNCEGTIDENFTGEVSAVFYHLLPNMPRYKVGDRVCQIKLGFTLPMEFEEVESLTKTDRGTGGYGSTGLK
jgi:dUTP pyrophosphatase